MPKDYAKRSLTKTRLPEKKRWRIEFLLIGFLIVVSVLGLVGWMCLQNNIFERLPIFNIFTQQKVSKANPSNSSSTQQAKSNNLTKEPDILFDFYTELPNRQVLVSEESSKKTLKAQAILPESNQKSVEQQYILQFGIFKNLIDASQSRLSLLLSGCEVDVVKCKVNGGDIYRVQRGPFTTFAQAKTLQKQLQSKGVASVLKKI